jgi:hypothetical protein
MLGGLTPARCVPIGMRLREASSDPVELIVMYSVDCSQIL